jgi:radical SAM superfamily enzyme YgiQ (UPF0313 family)
MGIAAKWACYTVPSLVLLLFFLRPEAACIMLDEIQIHLEYASVTGEITEEISAKLAARQAALKAQIVADCPGVAQDSDEAWLRRSYPVLSILAPVMSTSEEKIEFPGDPMCLYAALSYAVSQAAQTRAKGFAPGAPYNDLCPQWGYLPSTAYRLGVDENGIRQYDGKILNTDQTVFDPRVWNAKVKNYFVHNVLEKMQPRVVLISAVSPAQRYAIDIARTVRAHLPDCLIVLGGRHTDETLHYDWAAGRLALEPSSALSRMLAGSLEPVFDFLVAGEGYYALDVLMKAISLALEVRTKTATVSAVAEILTEFAPHFGPIPGQALIVALAEKIHAWPISGSKIDLSQLPAPYSAFAIRARFPIFQYEGRVLRTAHFMVTNACPYHCYFCSEGAAVVGEFLSFRIPALEQALERVIEYIEYGAEALFFDDSIFWGGNIGHIVNFCRSWSEIRDLAQVVRAGSTDPAHPALLRIFGREVPAEKVINLVWGAQVTVDFLASRRNSQEALLVLREMHKAGCTYLYMGIESMAEPVITRVHKNINKSRPWDERVRNALGLARSAGITVGSSVLFGLDGETQATIVETIDKVEELLAEDLLSIASPNILTYHPNTAITHLHQMEGQLDYHSANLDNRPPYSYFEEAFPAVVSQRLSEEQIWFIHRQTQARWGVKRNQNPMPPVILRDA